MVEVMNKLSQPLIINLNDGTSLHMLAKAREEITSEQFQSEEVKAQIANKNLIVLRIN